MIYNRETDRSRGFGFVTMSTVEEAEKAVELFNRYVSCSSFDVENLVYCMNYVSFGKSNSKQVNSKCWHAVLH